MDVLRSGYNADFIFFQDHLDFPVRVAWYRVPATRFPMDFPTIWTSSNWDDIPERTDYGDQRDSHGWTHGDNILREPLTDDPPVCGTLDQWQAPIDFNDSLGPLDPFTVPPCCGPQIAAADEQPGEAWDVDMFLFEDPGLQPGEAWDVAGDVAGPFEGIVGSAWDVAKTNGQKYEGRPGEAWDALAPLPTKNCINCPQGLTKAWTFQLFGITNALCPNCTDWQNVTMMNVDAGACTVQGQVKCGFVPTLGVGSSTVQLDFRVSAFAIYVIYEAPLSGWDCQSPLTLARTFPDPSVTSDDSAGECHLWPTSVVIYPSY